MTSSDARHDLSKSPHNGLDSGWCEGCYHEGVTPRSESHRQRRIDVMIDAALLRDADVQDYYDYYRIKFFEDAVTFLAERHNDESDYDDKRSYYKAAHDLWIETLKLRGVDFEDETEYLREWQAFNRLFR